MRLGLHVPSSPRAAGELLMLADASGLDKPRRCAEPPALLATDIEHAVHDGVKARAYREVTNTHAPSALRAGPIVPSLDGTRIALTWSSDSVRVVRDGAQLCVFEVANHGDLQRILQCRPGFQPRAE
jgi:hypothetical protein